MGIIAAVLIGALLLGDRLASPAELRRRFYQVGLGVSLLLLTLALSGVVFPSGGLESAFGGLTEGPSGAPGAREIGETAVEKSIFIAACGFVLLIGGLAWADKWPTSHFGMMAGGLLVLIHAATQEFESGASIFTLALSFLGGEAGTERNVAYAAALGAGTIGLLLFGYRQWDKPATASDATAPATA